MNPEISFVMPCLNEAETIAKCIQLAHAGARKAGVHGYEIIVADNGSMDASREIARAEGAMVVEVPARGYGAALRGGIEAARGKYVIMGDSDASYDFSDISRFVDELRKGSPLVMGSRLRGEIKDGAMPFLHRHLGVPLLTALGNLFFRIRLSDYHCGLRGFDREAIRGLHLRTEGMEFASEMIIRAALAGLTITEVPIIYHPAGRSRRPHLRTWRDGWRHLRFLLLYTPRWLLLYPGILLSLLGFVVSMGLLFGPVRIGMVVFDVHTLLFSATAFVLGFQLIVLAVFARAYASRAGLLPPKPRLDSILEEFSLGGGMLGGVVLSALGLAAYGLGLAVWSENAFGPLVHYQMTLRLAIAGTTLLMVGAEVFFASFIISLLSLR